MEHKPHLVSARYERPQTMMWQDANYIFYDIYNRNGSGNFVSEAFPKSPQQIKHIWQRLQLWHSKLKQTWGATEPIDPYPIFGGTVLFARGPSVESWPWWTGPATPAELQEGKPGEESREGSKSKCEIILSEVTKCHLLCCALHYII